MRRAAAIIFLVLTFFQAFYLEEVKLVSWSHDNDEGAVMESSCSSSLFGTPRSIRGFSGFFSYSRLQLNEHASHGLSSMPATGVKNFALSALYEQRQYEVSSPGEWGMPAVLFPRGDG